MTDYKLVPIPPTPEMVEAAEDAYMPFGDMDLAIRMAMLAAPAVQGAPENWREKVADLIKAAHGEGQKSATGRDPSPFRWVNSKSYKAAQALLAAPIPEAVQGEPVAHLRRDQLQQIKTRGPVVGEISPSPRGDMVAVYAAPQPAEQQPMPDVSGTVEALEDLVSEIENTTCTHDNTHRGGGIWEICEDCGSRWADDRGGKPEFSWPKSLEKAQALIAAYRKQGGGV